MVTTHRGGYQLTNGVTTTRYVSERGVVRSHIRSREAVATEEAARAWEGERERKTREREAEWEAERAEWQREREADMAAAAERDARLAELTARLAALDRVHALEPVRWEMPDETRERLRYRMGGQSWYGALWRGGWLLWHPRCSS